MNHEHNEQNTCQYCPSKSNEPILLSNAKTKISAFCGVCGSLSCYVAMFPAILLGVVGIFGLSQSNALSALNAYAASVVFQPILIISILLLITGLLRYGKMPLVLSVLGGIGIFVSMNFYMREWLFTLSFALVAVAYLLAFRETKVPQLKIAIVFLVAVVLLGIVDIARLAFSAPSVQMPAHTQPDNRTMDMMNPQ